MTKIDEQPKLYLTDEQWHVLKEFERVRTNDSLATTEYSRQIQERLTVSAEEQAKKQINTFYPTRLEYFAAAALSGLGHSYSSYSDEVANQAYKIAREMEKLFVNNGNIVTHQHDPFDLGHPV